MSAAFDRAYELTCDHEDAPGDADDLVNDPDDRGGLTYKGLTQRTYDGYRRKKGLPLQPVWKSTPAERRLLALEEFWLPLSCDQMPASLAIAVFDMAFHSSPRDAAVALQKALLVKSDGKIGPKTLDAARVAGVMGVLRFLKQRGAEMQQILKNDPVQVKYLEGWIARCLDQLFFALEAP